MIRIVIDFNDGYIKYYAGETVSESNFDAEKLEDFKRYGWVTDGVGSSQVVQVQNESVDLVIHDSVIGHTSEILNG